MTFNPGWDENVQEVNPFTDVRDIESALMDGGVDFISQTDKNAANGPASFMITDPDGNIILVDQHR